MAFIPVANTAQVDMVYSHGSSESVNTFYFEHSTGIDGAALLEITQALIDWYGSSRKAWMASDYSLALVRAVDLTYQDSIGWEDTTSLPMAGTFAGLAAPANVTAAIKIVTGFRGRSYRGRNFQVGVPIGVTSNDTVSSAYVNAILASYESLLETGLPENWTWVVVSRYHNLSPRTAGVTTPVIGFSMENVIDSQRRRLPGRGS